jgi:nucleoside-diphosphate-sugar epimerase
MQVFLTGATGFIGSRIIPELLAAGHTVLGLTRSDAGAAALAQAGAQVHRGTLEDPASVAAGAAQVDAVIHTAFDHDFSNFVANCEKDRRVIAAMGAALAGTRKPLLITSGTGIGNPGGGAPATEDVLNTDHPNPRIASELTGEDLKAQGLDVRVVRLPQVHDPERQGLISPLVSIAQDKGASAYVGDGANRWPACHVSDVARLYVLALDKGAAGERYNAVAEEGVAARRIAETLAEGLKLPARSLSPDEAAAHFGWMGMFVGLDMPASGAWTQQRLGWTPTGPDLIDDLKAMDYAAAGRFYS